MILETQFGKTTSRFLQNEARLADGLFIVWIIPNACCITIFSVVGGTENRCEMYDDR